MRKFTIAGESPMTAKPHFREIILYTGDQCSLCAKAKQLIYPLLGEQWRLREINIASDPELQARYGLRIPVAVFASGVEKGWPFTAGQIKSCMTDAGVD